MKKIVLTVLMSLMLIGCGPSSNVYTQGSSKDIILMGQSGVTRVIDRAGGVVCYVAPSAGISCIPMNMLPLNSDVLK